MLSNIHIQIRGVGKDICSDLIAIEGILKSKRISDTKFFPNDYSCSS